MIHIISLSRFNLMRLEIQELWRWAILPLVFKSWEKPGPNRVNENLDIQKKRKYQTSGSTRSNTAANFAGSSLVICAFSGVTGVNWSSSKALPICMNKTKG